MSAAKRGTERPSATRTGAEGPGGMPTDAPDPTRSRGARAHEREHQHAQEPADDADVTAHDADGTAHADRTGHDDGTGRADGTGRDDVTAHADPGPPPPGAISLPRQRQDPSAPAPLTLLVVGDDPTGAFTAPSFQDGGGPRIRVLRARNLTAAGRLLTDDVHCILLDLPDVLDAVRHFQRVAPDTAILVLTDGDSDVEPREGRESRDGRDGREGGAPGHGPDLGQAAEAVRIGAQDHLARDEVDAATITRAVRYAIERKRADLAQHQLSETALIAQENTRLERGLLPTPLLEGADLRFAARYRPGRSRALLGGDFYDTVRTPDGTVHAMIGDVCGHGPDAAALGVQLRIAWRALIFAGLGGDVLLRTLQQVLEHERADDEIFATLCTLVIAPDRRSADLYLAGHPAPLLARPGAAPELLPSDDGGPALGLLPDADWQPVPVRLDGDWRLMLYTDGLIEGRIGQGSRRLGQDGMLTITTRLLEQGLGGEALLDAAVTEARELNGGELTDDVALVLLERRP
ncbi:PP2C family protein-serine/threonine phosphatase [Streptomyces sp. CA-111067]|uniref:PP2C family protein-serine/threonine phosphatase n=1 Tax=Streptomyces sp. CA-111067 TaxID=3240046 RepID=UPI003D977F60